MSRISCPSASCPSSFLQSNLLLMAPAVCFRSGSERPFPLFSMHAPRTPAFGFRFTPQSSFGPYALSHKQTFWKPEEPSSSSCVLSDSFLFPVGCFSVSLSLLFWPLFFFRVHRLVSLLAHMDFSNGRDVCTPPLFVYGNHLAQVPMPYGLVFSSSKGFSLGFDTMSILLSSLHKDMMTSSLCASTKPYDFNCVLSKASRGWFC